MEGIVSSPLLVDEGRGLSQLLVVRLPDTTTIEIEACQEELILDLKQVLSEVLPTCFYTNFKFFHDGLPVADLADVKSLLPSNVPTDGPSSPPVLDIVPMRYEERSLKLHIRRMRELLYSSDMPVLNSNVVRPPHFNKNDNISITESNVMHIGSIDNDKSNNKRKNKKKRKFKVDVDNNTIVNGIVPMSSTVSKGEMSLTRTHPSRDPEYFTSYLSGASPMFDVKLDVIDRVIKCGNLSNDETVKQLTTVKVDMKKPKCVLSIKSNGWNPPNSHWRLRGDIWYLEIVTVESLCLVVVGQESGFIVAAETETSGDLPVNSTWWSPSIRPAATVFGISRFWTLHELLKFKSPRYASSVAQLAIDALPTDPNLPYRILPPFTQPPQWVCHESEIPSVDYGRLENALERGTGCDVWDATREWNEELQYSRELPRTDASLFSHQQQLRLRNRSIRKQQEYEMQGAPFSMITQTVHQQQPIESYGTSQTQHPSPVRSFPNGALFNAEDAAIIRDRNLCKLSSHLKAAAAQGAVNIREGRIMALGSNTEDQFMPYFDDQSSLFARRELDGIPTCQDFSCPSMSIDLPLTLASSEVKVYAWNNLFLVQASEMPEPKSILGQVGHHKVGSTISNRYSGSNSSKESDPKDEQTTSKFDDIPPDVDCCLATYFCTRRGMLADTRASELIGQIDSVQPVTFSSIPQFLSTTSRTSTAPSTPPHEKQDDQSPTTTDRQSPEKMLTLDESRGSNLYSLASSLVDYAGGRTLCQTIIPGMLSGELNSRPIYGAASLADPFVSDPTAKRLLHEFLNIPFGLKYHSFNDINAKQVHTCVPVECKVLEGADHRCYVSDVSRIIPIDLNWFTTEEIELLIHAKNRTDIDKSEMKMRQRIAAKNSSVLVRHEALYAYLYQAAKKTRLDHDMDWESYELEVTERDDRVNELKAKAAFEWSKTLGLSLCPEFVAHVPNMSPINDDDESNENKTLINNPMTEWPGLELYLSRERFQWKRMPAVWKQIAKCIAHKVTAFHLQSEREETRSGTDQWQAHDDVDEDGRFPSNAEGESSFNGFLDGQLDRWGLILGEGYQGLIGNMPVNTRIIAKFHNQLISATQKVFTSFENNNNICESEVRVDNDVKIDGSKRTMESTSPVTVDPKCVIQMEQEIAAIIESRMAKCLWTDRVTTINPKVGSDEEGFDEHDPEACGDVLSELNKTDPNELSQEKTSGNANSVKAKYDKNPDREERIIAYFPTEIIPPSLFNCNISNLCVDLVADEASRRGDVRQLENLAKYIRRVAVPRLVDHLVGTMDDCPLESGHIAQTFHAFGVNVRYLGMVIVEVKSRLKESRNTMRERVEDMEQTGKNEDEVFPLLVEVLERDMLSRCIAHQFNALLIKYPTGCLADVCAFILNLLVCPSAHTIPKPLLTCDGVMTSPPLPTQQQFWDSVSDRAINHFRYEHLEFPTPYINVIHHRYPIIRTVCQKVGIQLTVNGVMKLMKSVANDADLTTDSLLRLSARESVVNQGILGSVPSRRRGMKQDAINRRQKQKTPQFESLHIDDIQGFVSIIKSEAWAPSVANVSFATAVTSHSLDLFEVAFECYQQSVQILHKMNVPVSKEVLINQCCTAFVLINLGDVLAASLYLQKVIILTEKLYGPDHPHLISVYTILAKLSFAIIAAPDSTIQPQFAASAIPSSHQLFIQLHQLNLCKDALEKAVALAKLWTGVTHHSPLLPSLLIQSAKVALTSMTFISMLQQQASSIQLEGFSESTQEAIRQMLSNLPDSPLTSSSSPILADADQILSILYSASEMSNAMRKSKTVSLYTIAQFESELSAQYLASGETRRALDSARRHRDVLIQLLGSSHIEVELLDRQISALTRQAVLRAKHERSILRNLDIFPSFSTSSFSTRAAWPFKSSSKH